MANSYNLQIVGVNGSTNTPGDDYALDIKENQATNAILGKITGFENGEDLSKLIFTPDPNNFGDDYGRYGVIQATSADPGGQWAVGDWLVYVKDGGPINFNFEDRPGPNNQWTNTIQY